MTTRSSNLNLSPKCPEPIGCNRLGVQEDNHSKSPPEDMSFFVIDHYKRQPPNITRLCSVRYGYVL